jgi:hypothetical protein
MLLPSPPLPTGFLRVSQEPWVGFSVFLSVLQEK